MNHRKCDMRMRAVGLHSLVWLLAGVLVMASGPGAAAQDADDVVADAETWQGVDERIRTAAERVKRSMVRIETFGGASVLAVDREDPRGGAGGVMRSAGIAPPGEGPTTGLILDTEGHILTSTYNFLHDPAAIVVQFADGQRKVAQMLGRDPMRKVCVLRVSDPPDNLQPITWAKTAELRVGQWAMSLGYGFDGPVPAGSVGMISALHRLGGIAVQTDANLSPANYGGPLIDLHGRVIGVCVASAPDGGSDAAGVQWYDSGIGFAIPMANLARHLQIMKQGEDVQRGLMGIFAELSADPQWVGKGVVIAAVAANSPAAEVDIRAEDVITQIDGHPVRHFGDLRRLLADDLAGDTITVTFQRADQMMEKTLTLGAGPYAPPAPPQPPTTTDDPPEQATPADDATDEPDASTQPAEPEDADAAAESESPVD